VKTTKLPSINILGLKGCFIAGGGVLSTVTKQPVNDYDIYPKSTDDLEHIIDTLRADGVLVNISNNALTFKHNTEHNDVGERMIFQVVRGEYPTTEAIFNTFDFTVCMGAFDCDSGEYTFHESFWPDVASKTIHFNEKTSYPLASLIRLNKYAAKGYHVPKSQLAKIAVAIGEAGAPTSWQDVENQLGGYYGHSIALQTDGKEFSIPDLYDLLDTTSYTNFEEYVEDRTAKYSAYTFEDILIVLGIFKEEMYYFKDQGSTGMFVAHYPKTSFLTKQEDGTFAVLSHATITVDVEGYDGFKKLPDDALVVGWKRLIVNDAQENMYPAIRGKRSEVTYTLGQTTTAPEGQNGVFSSPKYGVYLFTKNPYSTGNIGYNMAFTEAVYRCTTPISDVASINNQEIQTKSITVVEMAAKPEPSKFVPKRK